MAVNEKDRSEVVFEIKEHLGVINAYSTGWTKELNLVSWNNGQPKYDIREWDGTHEHMSRGITLYASEIRKLYELLDGREL